MATKYIENFDYTKEMTIEIENTVDACKAKTCVAAAPAVRTLMLYKDVEKHPCLKWEYLFNADGTFATGTKSGDKVTLDATTTTTAGHDYVVTAYVKSKNTDIKVPAYRTANAKTLKIGEKMSFKTKYKDEAVFYEKVGEAYADELKVTLTNA